MIRKSGHRFSEKIMRKQEREPSFVFAAMPCVVAGLRGGRTARYTAAQNG
jgi:hypothetical protein